MVRFTKRCDEVVTWNTENNNILQREIKEDLKTMRRYFIFMGWKKSILLR